jgi:type III pantothenate kinase
MGFLAIDIGNTNITTGYFPRGDLTETLKIPSSVDPPAYWFQISEWLGGERFRGVQAIGASSVVKDLDTEISGALSAVHPFSAGQPPALYVITRDFPFPLKSAYQQGLLGTDRMLAAVAGAALLGKPVITVDIGSAVTIDLVDGEGVFKGGQILVGGGLRAKALAAFTSLLPEIPVPQSPPPLIGTSTVECLSSGIYHGMRAEIQGLVSQIQKEASTTAAVVLTGQGSRLFEESRPSGWQIEKFLVLKGIYYSCQGSGVSAAGVSPGTCREN